MIVRTVAQSKKTAELKTDLQNLKKQWISLCKKIIGAKTPSLMLNELNRTSSILRDLFDDSFTGVYSNNKDLCYEVKDYIKQIAPKKKSVVKYYKSDTPILNTLKLNVK